MPEPSQFNIDRTHPGRWTITFSNPPINMFLPTRFGLPTAAELQSSNDMIFPMLTWPSAQTRRAKLRGIGYGVPSDFELNFGRYLAAFGPSEDDSTPAARLIVALNQRARVALGTPIRA
jgi:hypothetical protein